MLPLPALERFIWYASSFPFVLAFLFSFGSPLLCSAALPVLPSAAACTTYNPNGLISPGIPSAHPLSDGEEALGAPSSWAALENLRAIMRLKSHCRRLDGASLSFWHFCKQIHSAP